MADGRSAANDKSLSQNEKNQSLKALLDPLGPRNAADRMIGWGERSGFASGKAERLPPFSFCLPQSPSGARLPARRLTGQSDRFGQSLRPVADIGGLPMLRNYGHRTTVAHVVAQRRSCLRLLAQCKSSQGA
jgi:hypothetical protein